MIPYQVVHPRKYDSFVTVGFQDERGDIHMRRVSVVIPVGPEPHHARWLPEAIQSVRDQTYLVDEILIVDDMHGIDAGSLGRGVTIWKAPWRMGVAHAFNAGVGLAAHELVFLLGADDTLYPQCIERCVQSYLSPFPLRDQTYYAVPVQYSDNRRDGSPQRVPCGAAMVTKSLWRHTGGFPVESASGASDAALLSILMANTDAGRIEMVGDEALYRYRAHDESETACSQRWQGVILETRRLVTETWTPPRWGALQQHIEPVTEEVRA